MEFERILTCEGETGTCREIGEVQQERAGDTLMEGVEAELSAAKKSESVISEAAE